VQPRLLVCLLLIVAIPLTLTAEAGGDSTPVGRLPAGPVTTVTTSRGSLVALAVPRQRPASGLVWRIARPVNATVVKQLSEADVGPSVVLVFRAVRAGSASIVLALTRGESSGSAMRAARYLVRVR
jgi:hypothetical protein